LVGIRYTHITYKPIRLECLGELVALKVFIALGLEDLSLSNVGGDILESDATSSSPHCKQQKITHSEAQTKEQCLYRTRDMVSERSSWMGERDEHKDESAMARRAQWGT